MIRAIRELEYLKGRKTIPREDRARARKNIEKLYTLGFTPEEIVYFASWITADTIKRYCRSLEVKESTQKEHAMKLLSQFAAINGDWKEFEYYIETKNKLKEEDYSLDDLLEVKKGVDKHDIDLEDVGWITAKLGEDNRSWEWFLEQVSLLLAIWKQGWTPEDLETLREKTAKMGFRPLLDTIVFTLTKEEVQAKVDEFNKEIEESIAESNRVEAKIDRLNIEHSASLTHIRYAKTLQDQYKIDIKALGTILETAEKGGDPIHVLDQLNKYLKTQELDALVQSQREKLEMLLKDILRKTMTKEELEKEVNELHMKIGAIEERHRHSRVLQNIANLLDNPAETELTPQNFNVLSLILLTSIRDYVYIHSGSNTTYERYVKNNVDNAVNNLNNIVSGKLT